MQGAIHILSLSKQSLPARVFHKADLAKFIYLGALSCPGMLNISQTRAITAAPAETMSRKLVDAVNDYAIYMLDPSGHVPT